MAVAIDWPIARGDRHSSSPGNEPANVAILFAHYGVGARDAPPLRASTVPVRARNGPKSHNGFVVVGQRARHHCVESNELRTPFLLRAPSPTMPAKL